MRLITLIATVVFAGFAAYLLIALLSGLRHPQADSVTTKLVSVGGCEYAVATGPLGAVAIAHHGACSNPIHRAK